MVTKRCPEMSRVTFTISLFFLMFVRIPHAVYVFEQLVHTHIYVFMNYAREQHLYVSVTSEMYVSTYI